MLSVKVSALAGAAVAALLTSVAGCAPAHQPAAGRQPSGSASPARSQVTSNAISAGSPSPPAGGPVPGRFAATSVTFVSADEAFVLGTAPCANPPCTSIVRTLDRGGSWRGLPAPVVPIGWPGIGTTPAVWGIRFATPAHGFVFGDGLWETADGGEHWSHDPRPGGSILALAALDGQVLALTARCSRGYGCQRANLLRRLLGGGSWSTVAAVHVTGAGPTDLIATRAGTAALLDGTKVVVTRDGGRSVTLHRTPCTTLGLAYATSVAVSSPRGLALLCIGQGYTGHTDKRIYMSADGGARWMRAGTPNSEGDGGTLAAATSSRLAIATASAASWLFHSGDAAASWQTVRTQDDGGMGWSDIGFTTAADGVVVHGPAVSDGNRDHRPGQLLLSADSGATWRLVTF
ncbi:MAG TPA: hypothetical protein VKD26_00935 [Streptosporangiaceae bacterium]|nr:hypothetical protein [Streptosporangiaceae bacterium]